MDYEDPDRFWEDFGDDGDYKHTWEGAETYEEALSLWEDEWLTGDMGGGEGGMSEQEYEEEMTRDRPTPDLFGETVATEETAPSVDFSSFVSDITDARTAKKYTKWGGRSATDLSGVVKAFKENPNNKTRAEVEVLYNKYRLGK